MIRKLSIVATLVVFAKAFWPSVSACIFWMSVLTCMSSASMVSCNAAFVQSLDHWKVASTTGLLAGAFAMLLTFSPIGRLHNSRYGHALLVGIVAVVADVLSHLGRYPQPQEHWFNAYHLEALLTGALSAVLALIGSYVVAGLRGVWSDIVAAFRPS